MTLFRREEPKIASLCGESIRQDCFQRIEPILSPIVKTLGGLHLSVKMVAPLAEAKQWLQKDEKWALLA